MCSAIASPTSWVVALPPKSGVLVFPPASTASMASSIAFAASAVSEMVEHHGAGPYLSYWIGNALPGNIRR